MELNDSSKIKVYTDAKVFLQSNNLLEKYNLPRKRKQEIVHKIIVLNSSGSLKLDSAILCDKSTRYRR